MESIRAGLRTLPVSSPLVQLEAMLLSERGRRLVLRVERDLQDAAR